MATKKSQSKVPAKKASTAKAKDEKASGGKAAAKKSVAAKKEASEELPAKGASTKKAPAAKVTTKKVTTKKVAAKKVAAKKVATKKVATKKVATKKVATEKVATKKVATKKVAGSEASAEPVKVKAKKKVAPKKKALVKKVDLDDDDEDADEVVKTPAALAALEKKLEDARRRARVAEADAMERKGKIVSKQSMKLSPFVKAQEQRLLELRDELAGVMNGVANDRIRQRSDDSGSAFGMHQADAGSDAYDRDFALSLLSQEQDALYEIEAALQRIRHGKYGVCEMSGKEIPRVRLEAIPFARMTVECQSQWEKDTMGSRYGRQQSGMPMFDGDM